MRKYVCPDCGRITHGPDNDGDEPVCACGRQLTVLDEIPLERAKKWTK